MRLISRFRRWLDTVRQPQVIYITPEQFQRYRCNSNYRAKRYSGPTMN